MTHPALLKATEIYDRPGDLESHELDLLMAVRLAGSERTVSVASAVRMFGDLTPAYHATVYLADRKVADDLAVALDRYEQSLEDQDLVEFAMAEAAE